MALTSGSRLGPYEILAPLGQGGMGEVYRARDSKLGREVAIKILPSGFTSDPERLARFEREARTLAALNHQHIGAIYGVEETGGQQALVLELVDGLTLAERLMPGPIPLAEALTIARQIADALDAAHEKGIVHRDLKPANVKITRDGVVKVLDFGLAKAAPTEDAVDLSRSPTITIGGTREGAFLGTAAYMSPEQARGKPVDKRADIWAFGCVLFEMLSGRPPFAGETVSDIISSILKDKPEWRRLPADTPGSILRLLRRCLEGDPRRRLRDIADAQVEMEDAGPGSNDQADASQGAHHLAASEPSVPALRGKGVVLAAVAIGIVAGALVATATLRTRPPASPGTTGHFVIPLATDERLAGLDFPAIAISPDGSMAVYVGELGGQTRLMLRPMDALESTALPGTTNAAAPFFSFDSRWIGFFADGKLKKVSTSGGAPVTLSEAPVGLGGSWAADDTIVFAAATGSGLSQVPANGGTPRLVTKLATDQGEFSHRWPDVLPDGKTVLYTAGALGNWDDAQIVAESLSTGKRTLIVQGGTNPHYLATGGLVYARGGRILLAPFDPTNLKLTGTPVEVLDGVLESADGAAQFTVSRTGTALYAPSALEAARRLVAVDRAGTATPLAAPPRAYATPRMSPDGRQLLLTIAEAAEDVWLYDLTTGRLNQVTSAGDTRFPIWTPDGQWIAFSAGAGGVPNLFWTRVGESGTPDRVASSEHVQVPGSWSPDGRLLAFVERHQATGRDIWLLEMDDRMSRVFLQSSFDESAPRFSPDGRWIAFVSNESGRNEVFVSPLSDGAAMRQISNGGGAEPIWGRTGRELFYRSNKAMMVAAVAPGDKRMAAPQVLFEDVFEPGTIDGANYDLTPDQARFVMVSAGAHGPAPSPLHVLVNWLGTASAAGLPGRR
jgi:serine/threonine-protein kinase